MNCWFTYRTHNERSPELVSPVEQKTVLEPNEFLRHLSGRIYECESLRRTNFVRVAELNAQYFDLPADFSDLALVAISERLNISGIATLDQDFDVYCRYHNQPFEWVFYPR